MENITSVNYYVIGFMLSLVALFYCNTNHINDFTITLNPIILCYVAVAFFLLLIIMSNHNNKENLTSGAKYLTYTDSENGNIQYLTSFSPSVNGPNDGFTYSIGFSPTITQDTIQFNIKESGYTEITNTTLKQSLDKFLTPGQQGTRKGEWYYSITSRKEKLLASISQERPSPYQLYETFNYINGNLVRKMGKWVTPYETSEVTDYLSIVNDGSTYSVKIVSDINDATKFTNIDVQ